MGSSNIDIAAIEAQLQVHKTPDRHGIRFRFLTQFAQQYSVAQALNADEQQELVAAIAARIGDWLPEERKAQAAWWQDLRWDDGIYEYGANNGGGMETFYGFLPQPHWLMPLARCAELNNPTMYLEGAHLNAFLQSPALAHLEILQMKIMLGPAAIEGIVTSGKLDHLRVLQTPFLQGLDKRQMKAFATWKRANGVVGE